MLERANDNFSRRRSKLERSRRKGFDQHYGKQTAGGQRNMGGAGKGDARRPVDQELYDIGWELSFNKDLSDEQRDELQRKWDALKRERA